MCGSTIWCARGGRVSVVTTIYMQLLDEGTDVWRPVEATQVADENYRIEGEVPEEEVWEFAPGSAVRCEWKTFSEGKQGLTAVSAVDAE